MTPGGPSSREGSVGQDLVGRLASVLEGTPGLAIAVSGGVDSLTLAHAAGRVRERPAVFHAVSPAVPPEATQRVRSHAREQGWRLLIIDAGEFDDPDYLANPVNRCFFCKRDLYGTIRRSWDGPLASGTNLDDLGDWRPGLMAAERHAVRHPFVEAAIDKAGVRALARIFGLGDVAELPAAPCLSSRLETGIRVTPERLALVHAVERLLRARLGDGTIRCRVTAEGLTIELDEALLARARDDEPALARAITALQPAALASAPLRFAPYRMGSAFRRDRATVA